MRANERLTIIASLDLFAFGRGARLPGAAHRRYADQRCGINVGGFARRGELERGVRNDARELVAADGNLELVVGLRDRFQRDDAGTGWQFSARIYDRTPPGLGSTTW